MLKKISTLFFISLFFIASTYGQRGEVVDFEQKLALTKDEASDFIQNLLPEGGIPSFAIDLLLGIDYGFDAYSVKYRTVDFDGTPRIATGLVTIPRTDCPMDMVSYGHGTVFNKDQVPSNLSGAGDGIELIFPLIYAGNGYLSVAPDYIGLGEGEGFHLYIEERTAAAATLDLMKASRNLTNSLRLKLTNRVFVSGYSQGGHSGMSTIKYMQEVDNAGFTIVSAGLGSGPYDLGGVQTDFILETPDYGRPAYLLITAAGCQEAGFNLFNDPSEAVTPQFLDDYNEHILGFTGNLDWVGESTYRDLFLPDYFDAVEADPNHPFNQCTASSNVHDWYNRKATAMYYCDGDEQVTPKNAKVAKKAMHAKFPWYMFWMKALIKDITLGKNDHGGCSIPYGLVSTLQFDTRKSRCWNFNKRSSNADAPLTRLVSYNYLDVNQNAFPEKIKTIQLFTFNGEEVASFKDMQPTNGLIKLNIKHLPNAAYIAQINGANGLEEATIVLKDEIEILEHSNYNPLSFDEENLSYTLDLSLMPEEVKTEQLLFYTASNEFVKAIPLNQEQEVSFSVADLSEDLHLLEVRSENYNFFLELERPTRAVNPGELLVYPNPAADKITVQLHEDTIMKSAILYNAQGQIVWSQENINHHSITPTLNLSGGVYRLQVISQDDKVWTKPLVIME